MAEHEEMPVGLGQAARRAASQHYEGFYMASALRAYARVEGLNAGGLAARLGCAEAALNRLALCRRPRGSSPAFRADVQKIAGYTGVSVTALASLLRRVDAQEALSGESSQPRGMLLAAREHEDATPSPEGEAMEGQS